MLILGCIVGVIAVALYRIYKEKREPEELGVPADQEQPPVEPPPPQPVEAPVT